MVKKPKIDPKELAVFHAAVKGVKPLTQKKVRLSTQIVPTVTLKKTQKDPVSLHFDEIAPLDSVQGDQFISYKQDSISDKALRKLRKGQYNIEAILDLHGFTVAKAEIALVDFLKACLNERIRVALIIHGKGQHQQMPILKNKLNHWLRQLKMVLAFCSATKSHGSRGALYVLLKRMTTGEVD